MKRRSRKRGVELFWPKLVLKKWLNISSKHSDFSADEENDTESDLDYGETCEWDGSCDADRRIDRLLSNVSTSDNIPYKSRRRKSETVRAQYINTKELRICVGTWNVGGSLPPDDLEIRGWLDMEEPADIYVLGLQEIVPLNAGNVLGAEDSRPVPTWESIIRETLNRTEPIKTKLKCHSDPPSPSRFKPLDDAFAIEDEISLDSNSENETDEQVYPLDDQSSTFPFDKDAYLVCRNDSEHIQNLRFSVGGDIGLSQESAKHFHSSSKRLDRLNQFKLHNYDMFPDTSVAQWKNRLPRTLSSSERMGLSWPEQPLNLSGRQILAHSDSFKSVKSSRGCKPFKFRFVEEKMSSETELSPELNKQNSNILGRNRPAFVRVVSKQMVGIFLSVWVRRNLRKDIQNLKISTVGVGVMGYIGNKGSISVSMSIYQTFFCFICSHLTSGEKDGDRLRRNADVQEIHRRTRFNVVPDISLPRTIRDHERTIWLGDLNYRLNLSYGKTIELISRKDWSHLAEVDQLKHELRKGRVFDGWKEGLLTFPPTYKYELNSENYVADDPRTGRTPAWCDRILSFGKGMNLVKYKRSEVRLSDHRPVTAIYLAEVEVFSHKKLQRALTFTDAEIDCEIISNIYDDS